MKKEIFKDLKKIKREIKEIVDMRIFGSRKKGNFSFWSDLDVFILVKRKSLPLEAKIDRFISNLELKYMTPIHVTLREISEWEMEKKHQTPFSQVIQAGIAL